MSCIRDIVTIVGGGGIDCVGATLWKLVSDYRSGEDGDHVCSDVPRMHAKQPLVSTQSRRDKGAWGKERPTQAIWLLLCTSQKILPVVRLSWLDSLGENSSTGTGTKTKIDLLGHCMVANSRSKFLDKYLQIAHSLGCLTEETERTIEAGQLDELASLRILSKHVKKELRKRPGWLLIIDGLSLDEELVKELRPFRPQPNDENWGKGQHNILHQ